MYRSCGKNGREERYIQGFCGVLVRRHDRKRLLGRHSCVWEGNIKMDLQEIWGLGLVKSVSGQGKVTGCCKRGNEPSGSIKMLEIL